MSDTSTIRADSTVCGQSQEACDSNQPKFFPSQFIDESSEAKILDLSTYEMLLSELLQKHWQKSTALGYPTQALPDKIIIIHNHPALVVPYAILADSELGRELATWYRSTFPNTDAPSVGSVFVADSLLTLLTNFTRQVGSTRNADHAQALLQAACIQTLEEFTTPTTYRFRYIEERHFYRLRLTLHHHRNHLVQDARDDKGRVLGRLSSWIPGQDDVTLRIQPLCGNEFSVKLSWREACDPASKVFAFPPLLNKEVSASYKPLQLNSTAAKNKMAGSHTTLVRP
jgi:hypothetical protein